MSTFNAGIGRSTATNPSSYIAHDSDTLISIACAACAKGRGSKTMLLIMVGYFFDLILETHFETLSQRRAVQYRICCLTGRGF